MVEASTAPDCPVHSSEADTFQTLMALEVEDSDATAPCGGHVMSASA